MSIRLQVRWPTPGHMLLQGAKVTVLVDGNDTPASNAEPGDHLFEIPDGSSHVLVKVVFEPDIPVAKGTRKFVVLRADQAYMVDGTSLQPDTTPFHLSNGELSSQNVNPLIDTIGAGNAVSGLTIAEVRTEWVDLTEYWIWRGFTAAGQYLSDTERDCSLVAAGSTVEKPSMWFATFPLGLAPPTPEVGALVFYRPSIDHAYTQPWEVHVTEAWFALQRYLLAPRDPEDPYFIDGKPEPRDNESIFFCNAGWIALRASFQQAQMRSGKPMVMLHPWPMGGVNFGGAATSRLPRQIRGILRMLRGMGHIATNHKSVDLGRLGLSGYSRGGPATGQALRANREHVRELYLFDPIDLAQDADSVIQWAKHTPDFRLRMSCSNAFASMMAIRNAVVAGISGEAGDAFVTANPQNHIVWEKYVDGGAKFWNWAIAYHQEYRTAFNVRHQYVLYGGNEFEKSGSRVTHHSTFLEDFLRTSGY